VIVIPHVIPHIVWGSDLRAARGSGARSRSPAADLTSPIGTSSFSLFIICIYVVCVLCFLYYLSVTLRRNTFLYRRESSLTVSPAC
jgi:hypothetical protein